MCVKCCVCEVLCVSTNIPLFIFRDVGRSNWVLVVHMSTILIFENMVAPCNNEEKSQI